MRYLSNNDLAYLLHDHVQCSHEFGGRPDADLTVKVIQESDFNFKVIAAFYEDAAYLDDAQDQQTANKIKSIIKNNDDEIGQLNNDFYL